MPKSIYLKIIIKRSDVFDGIYVIYNHQKHLKDRLQPFQTRSSKSSKVNAFTRS